VLDTAGHPIAGASVDVWQTNEDGFYDVQQKGTQPEMNLRGVFTTDAKGHYALRSVKPRHYPIPDDGPVGQLLRTLGRHPNRAAHIDVIVMAPGYEPVITHIFTPDCPYLQEDTVFGVKEPLIADLERVEDMAEAKKLGLNGPGWRVAWDFVLARKTA
jgi:catechol 1,2-dioxygenase